MLHLSSIKEKLVNAKKIAEKNCCNEITSALNEIIEDFNDFYSPKEPFKNSDININQDKALILGYYLARFDHYDIYPNLNQNAAFEKISSLINTKKTTLRFIRDNFDSQISTIKTKESPELRQRKGINIPLNSRAQKIFDYYKPKKRNEIIKDVLAILKEKDAADN